MSKWNSANSLANKICLVTGASRGIGKGIALQLGEAGATVYITGRTLHPKEPEKQPKDADAPKEAQGSLQETAAEIVKRGGKCIPVQCDHTKEQEITNLFEKIKSEQNGQLDVLVNNAFSAVWLITKNMQAPFWEHELSMWDEVNNVGLRNHYLCTVLASRLMVPRKSGLIVNISSAGGIYYFFNVAYGVGKEALDRMAVDCAKELRPHNVACLSLWPGPVKTELVGELVNDKDYDFFKKSMEQIQFETRSESLEFTGRAVVKLASDPRVFEKTGHVYLSSDIALEYGFTDIDGTSPFHYRKVKDLLGVKHSTMAMFVPGFVKVPKWVLALSGNKF